MKSRLLLETSSNDQSRSDGSSALLEDRRQTDPALAISPQETQNPPKAAPAETAVRPAPQVSNRPQGKMLLVTIFLACIGFALFTAWSTFLRFSAYGIVTGRVLDTTSPWPAYVEAVNVRAGDVVQQGDLLAIVSDPDLAASIDRLGDELRGAQAELQAQVAMLALAARDRKDENQKMLAAYYDLKGRLLAQRAHRDGLKSKLTRRLELLHTRAVSHEEIDSIRYEVQGLNDNIEHLQRAVGALKQRAEVTGDLPTNEARLRPWFAKIEQSQAAIRRLREKQGRGRLRASTSGTVLAIAHHVGERVGPDEPLLELLEDSSIELVVFVRQEQAGEFQLRQMTQAIVEPRDRQLRCQVVRIGDRYENPLAQIQSYYRPGENLLPIYLQPAADSQALASLRIGSVVQLIAGWQSVVGSSVGSSVGYSVGYSF